MKCPDHFFDMRKSDGVKNNNEEIFSGAHFLHKFSIDSCRRNEIFLFDFQHELKKMFSVLQTSTIGSF